MYQSPLLSPDAVKNRDRKNGISGLIAAPIGYLMVLFLPVFLEVASQQLALTPSEVGRLGAMDALGLAIGTLICAVYIKRLNFRHTVALGAIICISMNVLSAFISDFSVLCMIRVVAGLGEGLLVAIGVTAVGMTSLPERWFGLYTAAIVAVQAVGLLIIAPIFNQWQLSGVFITMALIYAIPLALLRLLPVRSEAVTTVSHQSQPTRKLLLAMFAMLFFYLCIGGVWAYVSFMGTGQGLSLEYVSNSLAISMLSGFLGALFFAAIGRHARNMSLLVGSIIIMITSLYFLSTFNTGFSYLIITCVYGFFWSVIGARLFSAISDADQSGRYISAAQTVLGMGVALGPLLASLLIDDFGYAGVNGMAAVALVLCLLSILPLALHSRPTATAQ
ncbi:MAG: MFS transporter [Paraglaciecola polaris]|uniref:MFS transporter n=1 Tax=Paraglaciecola polaris TaxID=222814 RepID=UPI0030012A03|tara:strand:- start:12560 stop:13729 length:1170 start_codon:yes stop_codon:yes gene_type:complete